MDTALKVHWKDLLFTNANARDRMEGTRMYQRWAPEKQGTGDEELWYKQYHLK